MVFDIIMLDCWYFSVSVYLPLGGGGQYRAVSLLNLLMLGVHVHTHSTVV